MPIFPLTKGCYLGYASVPFPVDPQSLNGPNQIAPVTRLRMSTGNFLGNASFGIWFNGTTVAPNLWTENGGVSVARSDTSTNGPFSAQLTFDTSNTGEFYQDADVSTEVDYTYTCYVQRISGSGNARLVAQEEGSPFTEFASVLLSPGAGWQPAMLTVKPSSGTQMRFSIKSADTSASVWLVSECMYQESAGVATTFQYAFIDDTNTQNIFGNKIFGFINVSQLQLNGASSLFSGTGAPAGTFGSVGSFYFRSDTPSTTNQRIYVKTAVSTWVGIV